MLQGIEGTYEALVFGEQHGYTGIDLSDCERDQHLVNGGAGVIW